MSLKLLVSFTALLVTVTSSDLYINSYMGADGKSYFTTPLYCNYSGSLLLTTYYNNLRKTYTTRTDRNCCYLSESRNQCCVDGDAGIVQQCRCSPSVTCGLTPKIDTTITTTSTATTPMTTTTTPTATTSTTTTTPTTTTTATTTTTTPTTTTTTSTTTTTTPQTTVPPSLCQPAFRVLNGVPVSNDCAFSGISNITILPAGRVTCNAVLTTASINGVLKKTFMTALACKSLITNAFNNNASAEISIGQQNYPIMAPLFNMTEGSNGVAYITINDRYINLLTYLSTCQSTACSYNAASMSGKVDFNDCKVVSWGASNYSTLGQSGLYETAVKMTPTGCSSISNLFGVTTTLCFTSISGQNVFCSGDGGAPAYCRAPSNGEWILVGILAFQTKCNASPEVKVIPYPS